MKNKTISAVVVLLLGAVNASSQAGIPGVLAAGAKVELAHISLQNADGIISMPDGSLLFAQEPASTVSRLDTDGKVSIYLKDTNGAGALAIDASGRIFAAQRHNVSFGMLAPERKLLVDNFQGDPLKGANDLVVDKKGGFYVTESGRMPFPGVYYINPNGRMTSLGNDIRANGIMLSGDERILYVTNGDSVLAFDVQPDGSVRNRREFGKLQGEGADGMAIDAAGRLYVTSVMGVQVFSSRGQHLGVIPTPFRLTSVAFAGRNKKTLFVTARGATGPSASEPLARSIYKVEMLTEGFKGRAK